MTLDEDVFAQLCVVARERGISFGEALNGAVRAGLAASSRAARPYRMLVRDMGLRPGVDLDKALRLVGEMEDAELVRKLELRK